MRAAIVTAWYAYVIVMLIGVVRSLLTRPSVCKLINLNGRVRAAHLMLCVAFYLTFIRTTTATTVSATTTAKAASNWLHSFVRSLN